MFDKFLKVAHQAPTASHRVSAEQDLFDFLSSEPKVACFTGHDDHKWLEQFAGTPMQEQAMALEQQDIQNEIAEKQYNMQNSGKQQSFWQNRDQIQLQKRMLELQLYQAKTGPSVAAAASGAPAPTGPEADAATVGAGGGSPATPETGMMETGAKVAKANPDGTYTEDFLYGAVPGAVGGFVTGTGLGDILHPVVTGGSAGLGGALSRRGGRAADQVGVSHTEGAKRSAIGQMIGGGLGAVGAGLATGGHPVAVPAGGVLGALSGHALAMQKYRNMAQQQAAENEEPDAAKLSAAEEQFLWADRMGRMMAKQALDMTALKGLGNTALDWAKKNPTKALSAAGGVAGATYGAATAKGQNGQGPTLGQRLGRAAGFGAMGAGAGAVAGQGVHVGRRMAGGETFGKALGGHLESGVSNQMARMQNNAASQIDPIMRNDAQHLMDTHISPAINKLQEGIAGRITNNPYLQFGGAK